MEEEQADARPKRFVRVFGEIGLETEDEGCVLGMEGDIQIRRRIGAGERSS